MKQLKREGLLLVRGLCEESGPTEHEFGGWGCVAVTAGTVMLACISESQSEL